MIAEKEFRVRCDTAPTTDVHEILEGRIAFYSMLAGLYFQPLTSSQIEVMASADLVPNDRVNEEFDRGVKDLGRYLQVRNSGTRQELAVDFTSSFGGMHTYEGRYALPYKSFFMEGDPLFFAEGHKEVFDAFKKACVRKREGLDYPDDHLSFLCEFMALMGERCLHAWEQGGEDQVRESLELSRSFLQAEILSWFDDFSALARTLIHTRFYRGVLSLSKGYFLLDLEVLRDLATEVRGHGIG